MFLGGDPGDHAHFREVTNINRDYRVSGNSIVLDPY